MNKKRLIILFVCIISTLCLNFNVFAIDNSFDQDNDIIFYSELGWSRGCRVLIPVINDKTGLAKVIDDYIKEKFSKSPFNGLGESFVNGAVATGISPFVAIAHLRKESIMGTASTRNWFNYVFSTEQAAINEDQSKKTTSYNGFGRKASGSQPTVWYPSRSGPVPVYKWSSWKASIDSTTEDTFFQYYKRKWVDEEQATTFEDIIPKYSGSENPNGYISQMNDWVDDLIKRAGDTITCNNSIGGGLTLSQAKNFVNKYKSNQTESLRFTGGASRTCPGGPLANCVSFSTYFINKYTSLGGFTRQSGNGWEVAQNVAERNPPVTLDHNPEPFSIFSKARSPSGPDGHTGVVLGVDIKNDKIIIGEAGCGQLPTYGYNFIDAKEKSLSDYSQSRFSYAHITNSLNIDLIRSDAGI